MKKIKSFCAYLFFRTFWKCVINKTNISVIETSVWQFYFIPRKPVFTIVFILLLPLIVVIFGLVGSFEIAGDIMYGEQSQIYTIEKELGSVPTINQCYEYF